MSSEARMLSVQPKVSEVEHAFQTWMADIEFTVLPAEVLRAATQQEETAEQADRDRKPWWWLFVAMNFYENTCFEEAAACYFRAFAEAGPGLDNEGFWDLNRGTASNLELFPDGLTIEERQRIWQTWLGDERVICCKVAATLERMYTHRACLLEEAKPPYTPGQLTLDAAMKFLADRLPSLSLEQLHVLLFYADALCFQQFQHRLFVGHTLRAQENGLVYTADDDAGSEPVTQPSLSAEHKRILNAVCTVGEMLPPQQWEREPAWLAAGDNQPVSDISIRVLLGCDPPISELFSAASAFYFQAEAAN